MLDVLVVFDDAPLIAVLRIAVIALVLLLHHAVGDNTCVRCFPVRR